VVMFTVVLELGNDRRTAVTSSDFYIVPSSLLRHASMGNIFCDFFGRKLEKYF